MPDPVFRFYTSEQLGTTQSLTPDGFLLCREVPIARIGTMLYSDGEVPVTADRDGIIRIHRDADEVFAPNAITSFAGKPVTNDHPPEKVNPHNWRNYAVGTVLHPRRGDGLLTNNDFLYADLLIQDEDAIRDIRSGKREVSAGYDAEYDELAPGEGRQHGIIGNHVALVDRGRCGYSCHIGDKEMAGQARRRPSVGDTLIKSSFDRILKSKGTTSFDAVLVEELSRVATMLGDILSGATESGGFATANAPAEGYGGEENDHTADRRYARDDMAGGGVHVHLHNPATDAPEGDPAAAPAAGAGAEGGGDLEQRVSALERAVAILAQGEQGEDPQETQQVEQTMGDPNGDPSAERRPDEDRAMRNPMRDSKFRARDEEPTAPPVDEPDDATGKENVAITDRRRAAVGDSSSLRGPWQEMISKAELLAPGIKYPVMDAKRGASSTMDAMCKFRRRVVNEALQEDDTAAAVRQVAGDRTNVAQMSCDAISAVFNGAAELVRQKRSSLQTAHVGDGVNYSPAVGFNTNQGMQAELRRINEKNAEFYAKQQRH